MPIPHRSSFFAHILRFASLLALLPMALAQPQYAPTGIQKISHVVFLIKENRTYDNIFGAFNAKYGTKTCKLSTGQTVPMGRAPDRYEHDISHAWDAAHLAMDGGKMDQFDLIGLNSAGSGDSDGDLLTCRQFTAADIPDRKS